jgi:PKHD-type hydroxylase
MTITNSENTRQPFNFLHGHLVTKNFLSVQDCEKIRELGLAKDIKPGLVNHLDSAKESEVRKNKICWLYEDDTTEWLFDKLQNTASLVNDRFFNFNINCFEPLQFTMYDTSGDHYGFHTDLDCNLVEDDQRKLSFIIQLTDENEYKGCDVEFLLDPRGPRTKLATRQQGSLIIFSSLAYHRVTPLLEGTRISLVGWIRGRPFR